MMCVCVGGVGGGRERTETVNWSADMIPSCDARVPPIELDMIPSCDAAFHRLS